MSVFLLILGVVLFVGLVVIHEFGHFIAARRGGIEVEEFGIGFPPKIWSREVATKNSSFLFTINALPLGGFVRLKGENDAADTPGSFGAAPLLTKTKVMLAGVLMNLLVAFGLFTILALIGMPKIIPDQFTVASDTTVSHSADIVLATNVVQGQPADKAGVKANDRLVALDGTPITEATKLSSITETKAGQTVLLTIERNGSRQDVSVTLNQSNSGTGYLGVGTAQNDVTLQRSTWSAPVVAIGLTGQLTKLTFQGLGTIIGSIFQGDTKSASEQVTGPVGIAVILKQGSQVGINFILFIIAVISLSLAIMNVLPIPALDGGRLFLLLLFRALKKPLTKEIEERVVGTSFMILMALFVLITIVDIKRFF